MAQHSNSRRTPVRWLRDDPRKALGPCRAAKLLRREPGLLGWLLLYVAIALAGLAAALFWAGRLDLFAAWAGPAAIFGGGLSNGHFERALTRRSDLQR